ncbi:MAG: zf-HC2 domain-containing protein, partial [Oscillibacter sp.]|nr:zf-HC2 domain-containing protein [Oscillibacter sp.]
MSGERKACEYTALLDAFVDGELPEDQAARLREHLDSCPACRSYLDDILAIREAFPTVEDTQVPEGFADRVLDKLPARVTVLPTRRRMLRRAALPVAASLALILALRGVWLTGGMNAEDVMSRTLPTVEEAAEEAVEETETADGPAADEGPADSGATTSDTDAGTPEDAGSGDAEAGTEEVPASGTDSGMAETASSTTEAGEETGADSAAADGAAAETKADSSTGAGNRENNTRNAQSASNTNNNTNTTSRSGNTARNKDSAVNGKTGGGTAGGNTAAVSEQAAPAAAEQAAPGETEQTAPVEAEQAAPGETEQTAQTASTPAEAEQTPPPVPPAPAVEQLEDGQEGFVRREWESGSSSPVSGYENLDGAVSLLGIDDPADGEAL